MSTELPSLVAVFSKVLHFVAEMWQIILQWNDFFPLINFSLSRMIWNNLVYKEQFGLFRKDDDIYRFYGFVKRMVGTNRSLPGSDHYT